MNQVELHQTVLSYLRSQFNIKFATDCRNFDLDPQILVDQLLPFKGQYFTVLDKILLVHMDTDYYDDLLPYGLIPINVIRIFKNLDIPLHSLLFITNHYGISKEFDALLENQNPKDRPQVIETLLSPWLLSESFDDQLILDFKEIEKSAICMMNTARSHRIALYNFFLDQDLTDKIAISQDFNAQ